jgi:prepilin-type N-terminal cleavage/methylation domain-containing protein
MKLTWSRSGFSLVELSIVLVILGLLTGGILSGQALIRAAEIRSVSIDIQKYTTAIFTFRDKYFALPGDMTNATAFWGVAAGDGNAATNPCLSAGTDDGRTCNGNGDGRISDLTASPVIGESFRMWQHLSNASLVEGRYRGAIGADLSRVMPSSKAKTGSAWFSSYPGPVAGNTSTFAATASQLFQLYGSGLSGVEFLRPEEAWNLDTKMDDGRPNLGSIRSNKGTAAIPCSTTFGQPITADVNTQYNLSSQVIACYIEYRFN